MGVSCGQIVAGPAVQRSTPGLGTSAAELIQVHWVWRYSQAAFCPLLRSTPLFLSLSGGLTTPGENRERELSCALW